MCVYGCVCEVDNINLGKCNVTGWAIKTRCIMMVVWFGGGGWWCWCVRHVVKETDWVCSSEVQPNVPIRNTQLNELKREKVKIQVCMEPGLCVCVCV